ncbi:hypothetical protein B0H13DRAFT_2303898 [Mycena leptocephala]|nr:hypothetical protein B0H13DRAFT_2303898 [Mycena leptocephala]
MDPVLVVAPLSHFCTACRLVIPSASTIFKCLRCRTARFCSAECQLQAAHPHRPDCFDFISLVGDGRGLTFNNALGLFNHWLTLWNRSVGQWLLFAMDLPQKLADLLLHHSYVNVPDLAVRDVASMFEASWPRPPISDPLTRQQGLEAGVIEDSQLFQRLLGRHPAEVLRQLQVAPRNQNSIRLVIITGQVAHFSVVPLHSLRPSGWVQLFCDTRNPTFSRCLRAQWPGAFNAHLRQGDVRGSERVLEAVMRCVTFSAHLPCPSRPTSYMTETCQSKGRVRVCGFDFDAPPSEGWTEVHTASDRFFWNVLGLHEHYRQSEMHHYGAPCRRLFQSASSLNSHVSRQLLRPPYRGSSHP